MSDGTARRRRTAFAGGLAATALALGFAAVPAQAAPAAQLSYVAVGDSYTAGTGAGAASNPGTSACWQSSPGYVADVGATGRVSLVINGACHGALLSGGLATSVKDQIGTLAYAGALNASTGLVTITAGANDAGVNQVIGVCATSPLDHCAAAVAASQGALPAVRDGLTATYAGLHSVAPNAKIAVLGYPRLFAPADGIPQLSAEKQVLLNQATDRLNAAISEAVGNANFGGANAQFVDVTARFAGHEANSLDPWIVLDRDNPFADSNFHPNAAGHALGYAAAVMGEVKPAKLARQ
jgi:lysophospholipase L1-like esterase